MILPLKRSNYFLLVCLLLSACLLSCSKKQSTADQLSDDLVCACPPVFYLQPYGNFTQQEAGQLKRDLLKYLPDIILIHPNDLEIEIQPSLPLTNDLMNEAKTRYRADKIVNSLAKKANSHLIIVGVTHKDISCTVRGHQDWGVQGLSGLKKNTCVVSTFRVKNKRDLGKVAAHELVHTVFNYGHCPKNDPTCLMQDANGHPNYNNKTNLCKYCQTRIFKE